MKKGRKEEREIEKQREETAGDDKKNTRKLETDQKRH